MYAYLLSKENISLSMEEVCSLAGIKDARCIGNILILDSAVDFSRLAYTKSVFKVLFEADIGHLRKRISEFDFQDEYHDNFCVRVINTSENRIASRLDFVKNISIPSSGTIVFSEQELSSLVGSRLRDPKADLLHPATEFCFLFHDQTVICTRRIFENRENFSSRKSHLRPEPHPTSLNPRLARCLVNIAASGTHKDILDPFCGSGGILIEAALMGLSVKGFDIDEHMLERARKNMEFYDIKGFILEKRDALGSVLDCEIIVSDLPYARASRTTDQNLENLYRGFLLNASSQQSDARRMVICVPEFREKDVDEILNESVSNIDYGKVIAESGWKMMKGFSVYLHKSLTKRIFLLERQ